MKPRWYDWLTTIVILFALIFLFGFMTETYTVRREAKAFEIGVLTGKAEVLQNLKANEATVAIQWWVGSKDMEAVRKRLCSNVSPNAFKEVKK